jgi:hypothetical protein
MREPAVTGKSPVIVRNSVVLPAPFEPISTEIPSPGMVIVTSQST